MVVRTSGTVTALRIQRHESRTQRAGFQAAGLVLLGHKMLMGQEMSFTGGIVKVR